MIKKFLFITVLLALYSFGSPLTAVSAFQGPGCMGSCTDCHSLTKEDATKLLKTDKFKATVKDIRMSPVKGLWEVEINQGDKAFIVYVDFAKKFLVEGKFTPLEKLGESAPMKKVDLAKIPLDNAVVFGSRSAPKKIIVFDDPECPYCVKLHQEIKKIIEKRKDVAFYVKMYPLAIHPDAYEKSKAIVCSKSGKLLDDAFAGKKLPKADCDTKELDNNIKLAEELEIHGTPALIFPDGRLFPGYAPAETLLGILDNPQ
ncbi:MAG: DsbC family protein [Deltaproteobacteria bacterium]|nr:DsbC family protein [Deltaproteobacteria bacterium]